MILGLLDLSLDTQMSYQVVAVDVPEGRNCFWEPDQSFQSWTEPSHAHQRTRGVSMVLTGVPRLLGPDGT